MRQADPSVATVARLAEDCRDLPTLAAAVAGCVACPELAATRTTVVVGETPSNPRLALVGEAPGAQEDASGRPFVGAAGQLLDELLAAVGIDRTTVAVLNVLKCRPPANRTPRRAEAIRCSGWLDRQIALLDPSLVMTLGRTALSWAMSPAVTLAQVRGRVHDWRGRRLVASYHPSAAIRFGPAGQPRAALAADLRLVADLLACR